MLSVVTLSVGMLSVIILCRGAVGWARRDNHSSLLQTLVNYDRKKFYNIWPGQNLSPIIFQTRENKFLTPFTQKSEKLAKNLSKIICHRKVCRQNWSIKMLGKVMFSQVNYPQECAPKSISRLSTVDLLILISLD